MGDDGTENGTPQLFVCDDGPGATMGRNERTNGDRYSWRQVFGDTITKTNGHEKDRHRRTEDQFSWRFLIMTSHCSVTDVFVFLSICLFTPRVRAARCAAPRRIVSDRFRTVSDRFQSVPDHFRTVWEHFQIVFGPFCDDRAGATTAQEKRL